MFGKWLPKNTWIKNLYFLELVSSFGLIFNYDSFDKGLLL